MGMYDLIEVSPDVLDVAANVDGDWQTKTLGDRTLHNYRITDNGELQESVYRQEKIPEDERFDWGDGSKSPSHRPVVDGWESMDYTGTFEFHGTLNQSTEHHSYEVDVVDGTVEEIRPLARDALSHPIHLEPIQNDGPELRVTGWELQYHREGITVPGDSMHDALRRLADEIERIAEGEEGG